jgi:flagellar motor switch protein FliN/FliY
MDGVLSQEEINALLNDPGASGPGSVNELTDVEKDEIGEIANICMGTAATTLFSLVNRKVEISTPVVSYSSWNNISSEYERPCVFIRIAYTEGLDGNNILILKENDVKIITDLMMGGDGTNIEGELGELHLSAICEAMNQMMGSASTSLSSMLDRKIDISPPTADVVDMTSDIDEGSIDQFLTGNFVKISFHMEIGDLVDSTIMQLYPVSFAKEMCEGVMHNMNLGQDGGANKQAADTSASSASNAQTAQSMQQTQTSQQTANAQQMNMQSMMGGQMMNGQPMMGGQMMNGQPMMGGQMMNGQQIMGGQPMMGGYPTEQSVNVQPAQFSAFSGGTVGGYPAENIGLIMDVPLEVTVELGRTQKSISDILDFGPGKIIELNKIAGEPIDVLVNGKYVAKGEVVVIEESFGVRITEIVNAAKPT